MSNIASQMITFPSNGQTTPGYLAYSDNGRSHPAIVVIQEWWGLVDHIKEMCERFAQAGFVALAPDLYHGQKADEPDDARKLAMALDVPRALYEIQSAAIYLQSLDHVSSEKIGVVGWCMGGMAAFQTAVNPGKANIGAVVGFYGRPPTSEDVPKINAPILGLFGDLDQGIPVDTVKQFEKDLKANNKTHHIEIYQDAHHAFFNDTRLQIYNEAAAKDAWQRTQDWFNTYL